MTGRVHCTPEAMKDFGRMVRCSFCESLNPVTEQRCTVCKEALHSQHEGHITFISHPDEFKCPSCRRAVKRGARSCPSCGKALCVVCHHRLAVLQNHCGHCVGFLKRR